MKNQNLSTLVFRNFPRGEFSNLDADDYAEELRDRDGNRIIPTDAAYSLRGVYIDKMGLRHIGKPEQFVPVGEGEIGYITAYQKSDGASEVRGYFTLRKTGGNWHVRSVVNTLYNNTANYNTIHTIGTAITSPQEFSAITAGKRFIFGYTDGYLQVCYDLGNSVAAGLVSIDGAGETITPEIRTPTTLTGPKFSGDPKYRYLYVLEDGEGNLTNPSLITADADAIDNPEGVEITLVFDKVYSSTFLTDNDIVKAHVFRIGGNNGLFRLAKTFVPDLAAATIPGIVTQYTIVDDATGLYPVDTTPDELLPDIFPSESRLAPPKGLNVLEWHQNRVFAAGYSTTAATMAELGSPARLWFSRANEPEAWGEDDNGQDDDGGFIDIDDNHFDRILQLCTIGSLLVIGRLQSVYTLYGSGFNTFRFDKRADHGLASHKSLCRHGNTAFYLASNRKFYRIDDAGPSNIPGAAIEKKLEAATDAEIRGTVVWSHDRRVYLSIPKTGTTPICYCYDVPTGAWVNLDYAEFRVNYATSIQPFDGGLPLLHLCRTGAVGSFVVTEGLAYDWLIEVISFRNRFENYDLFRLLGAYVEGDFDTVVGSSKLAITATVGSYNRIWALDASASGNVLSVSRVHSKMVGTFFKFKVDGTLSSGYLTRFAFEFLPVRQRSKSTAATVIS